MLREIMIREKGRNEKKNFPGGGVLNAKNTNVYNIVLCGAFARGQACPNRFERYSGNTYVNRLTYWKIA